MPKRDKTERRKDEDREKEDVYSYKAENVEQKERMRPRFGRSIRVSRTSAAYKADEDETTENATKEIRRIQRERRASSAPRGNETKKNGMQCAARTTKLTIIFSIMA